jgi:COP9 signalosome complex subunit 1
MCVSVLEVLLEQQNHGHLSTYTYKAETALDPNTQASAAARSGGTAAGQNAAVDKAKVMAKLELASAMAEMAAGRYDKAAYAFLRLNKDLDDWSGKVILNVDCMCLTFHVLPVF